MFRYYLAIGLAFLFQHAASADSCRVVTVVDNNPWEEGLGVYGDPDVDDDSETVDVSEKSVSVGQMTWRKPADEIKKTTADNGSVTYHVRPKGADYSVSVLVHVSERGVVLHREAGKSRPVATFDCSSVTEVESASLRSSNVKAASQVPKSVRDNVSKVDLALELGDGYYDLKSSKLYVVHQRGDVKTVLGYLLWAKLHYTEDNEDIEVLVRFDRNGLRLGEIER